MTLVICSCVIIIKLSSWSALAQLDKFNHDHNCNLVSLCQLYGGKRGLVKVPFIGPNLLKCKYFNSP